MKKIFAVLAPAFVCAIAVAQNLNPTVDITNTYLSKTGETTKYVTARDIPDSLTHFDYKFDYSVFDAPYKGAFEFSPYAVSFNLENGLVSDRKFFLRAGAGYPLHPQFQAVWNPVRGDKFRMNVHQDFSGYLGRYKTVTRALASSPMMTTKGVYYDGYDLSELAGADGSFNLGFMDGGFSVDYNGIFTKDEIGTHSFNSAIAKVSASSNAWDAVGLNGFVVLDFATDRVPHPFGARNVGQGGADVNITAAPDLGLDFGTFVDLRFKYVGYSGAEEFAPTYFGFAVTPRVNLQAGPVNIDAGVRLDGSGTLHVAPVVKASVTVFDSVLDAYAAVTGGTKFNTMSDFVRDCHWYSPVFSENITNSFERINARLGVRGSLFSRLQYDLYGGWASEKDMSMWGVESISGILSPRLGFRDVNYAFADLMLAWKSDRIDADGKLMFRKSQLGGCADVFDFPDFSGNFQVMYNWDKRIYAGARAVFSTARIAKVSGVDLKTQPYVDLGVFGEYRLNSLLSFWLEGANILNEIIQTVPMHVESGINFTAGICLNL